MGSASTIILNRYNTPHSLHLQKRAAGDVLLTEVFKHLGLDESDYFGLQYLDKKEQVVSAL